MNEAIRNISAETGGRLERELAEWTAGELTPRIFVRDDDAIEDTPALRRLLAIIEHHNAPLLLAVIPEPAKPDLAELLTDHPLVTPAVHGFRHKDHAPYGKRSRELGLRPVDEILAELTRGRGKLSGMFGERLSGILVPPWNRIDTEVAVRVSEAGFCAISTHGWDEPEDATPRLNTHVDIVHWSGGQIGRSHDWVFGELADNLAAARQRGGAPIGLLTHHLAHDEQAWNVLEDAMTALARGGAVWNAADELLAQELA